MYQGRVRAVPAHGGNGDGVGVLAPEEQYPERSEYPGVCPGIMIKERRCHEHNRDLFTKEEGF